MATVLFAYERATRSIDTATIKPWLAGAAAQGHRVVLVTSDLIAARQQLCQLPATVTVAPGTADSTGTSAPQERWHSLYQEFQPDLVLAVDSPRALAAATQIGGATVLVHAHLAPRDAHPARLEVVTCFPELGGPVSRGPTGRAGQADPEGTIYAGAQLTSDGVLPRWPTGNAQRVFALIDRHPQVPIVLDMLRRLGQRTLAAVLECPPPLLRLADSALHIEAHPVQLQAAAKQCHYAILHGDLTEVSYFLQHGVPLLLLPTTEEQRSSATAAAATGSAIVADIESPISMVKGWLALQQNETYRQRAGELGRKHKKLSDIDPFSALSSKLALG